MHHQHMTHDGSLVVLSFVVALLASYTALDMGTRLKRASGNARLFWLCSSAVVLGGGIWSMHFVAMLAMSVGMPVGYEFHLTALSLLMAIGIVAFGFHIVTRANPSITRQVIAGSSVGIGVAAMHYTGMSAVIVDGAIRYDTFLVVVSIAIAVVAATAALWLTLNLTRAWHRVAAAFVMATAVCGMHYTAMAATSMEMSGAHNVVVDPQSRLILAAAVSIGLFLILCLAMVCVFADRRFEFMAEREAESLRNANAALTESQDAMRNLLDNVDQGFLTVTADLQVGAQFSGACETILGAAPAGRDIVDLLCVSGSDSNIANMRTTLESVFHGSDDFVRDLKVELLPKEFSSGGRFIKVSYKFLADSNRLMFILTDITQTRLLTEAVEHERKRLEMIVLAVTDGEAFGALVSEYRQFLLDELPDFISRLSEADARRDLYRRLHTFKGLLAQFSFSASPASLHEMETRLSEIGDWQDQTACNDVNAEALLSKLDADLNNVTDVLGADYVQTGARIVVPQEQVQTMTQLAETALAGAQREPSSGPLRLLKEMLVRLNMLDVKAALLAQTRGTCSLAARLGKRLAPIIVEGDTATLPVERYGAFFRSLVHVFRNAVDHGIETPEGRALLGKVEAGSIRCTVLERRDGLEILIADDGRGIDRAALAHKLTLAGETESNIASLTLKDLAFRDGLSCRDGADEVSGRGVGLGAVKAEIERLGGLVSVTSELGSGVQFRFLLPAAPVAENDVERIAV